MHCQFEVQGANVGWKSSRVITASLLLLLYPEFALTLKDMTKSPSFKGNMSLVVGITIKLSLMSNKNPEGNNACEPAHEERMSAKDMDFPLWVNVADAPDWGQELLPE